MLQTAGQNVAHDAAVLATSLIAAAIIVLAVVDLLVPNAARMHGIRIVVTAAFWAVFLAKSFMAHRYYRRLMHEPNSEIGNLELERR